MIWISFTHSCFSSFLWAYLYFFLQFLSSHLNKKFFTLLYFEGSQTLELLPSKSCEAVQNSAVKDTEHPALADSALTCRGGLVNFQMSLCGAFTEPQKFCDPVVFVASKLHLFPNLSISCHLPFFLLQRLPWLGTSFPISFSFLPSIFIPPPAHHFKIVTVGLKLLLQQQVSSADEKWCWIIEFVTKFPHVKNGIVHYVADSITLHDLWTLHKFKSSNNS